MWIKRKYESTLRRLFDQFPVAVVTGARQVGKTSLVRKVFPDFSYISLDVPSIAAQAEQNASTFLDSYKEPLIIDEVQYAPSLLRSLKVIVDRDKRPGRFIVVEAKFSEAPDKSALKGIKSLQKFYGSESIMAGFIASRTGTPYPLDTEVSAVPGSFIDTFISREQG